jgi:voltage-gated sodium channel
MQETSQLIIKSDFYQTINFLLILVNCVDVVMESMKITTGKSSTMNILITIIFTFDIALQMLAYGLFADKKSFFRKFWSHLDFVVVVTNILNMTDTIDINLGFIRTLRLLRIISKLNRFPSLFLVVNSIIRSIPQLYNCLILLGLFYFVFSMTGLLLFAGNLTNRCFHV